jgi:hypothetical protein
MEEAENNARNDAFPRAFTKDFLIGEAVAALVGCGAGAILGSEAGPPGEAVGCGGGAAGAVSNPEIGVGILVTAAVVATYEGYSASKEAKQARKNYESVCQ